MFDARRFEKNLRLLIAASRGGPMRYRILHELIERPQNPNQLSEKLRVDYKTVTHHLSVLQKNNWVTSDRGVYGELFSCSFTSEQKTAFEELWKKIGSNPELGKKL